MSMPGNGPHLVAPGQITDDGELTHSLLNGLLKGSGEQARLDLKEIV
jgi:ADP-ribosylglycohydrolase